MRSVLSFYRGGGSKGWGAGGVGGRLLGVGVAARVGAGASSSLGALVGGAGGGAGARPLLFAGAAGGAAPAGSVDEQLDRYRTNTAPDLWKWHTSIDIELWRRYSSDHQCCAFKRGPDTIWSPLRVGEDGGGMTNIMTTSTGRWMARVAGIGALTVSVVITINGAASAAVATGSVLYEGSARAVPGSYIVVLKDAKLAADAVGPAASGLASNYGGTVQRSWGAAIRGFEFTGTALAARRLAANPAVAYVEQNQVYTADVTQTGATWGIDRIDQRALPLSTTYTYSTTASNVHAYIIDTGILTTHTQFGGRASSGFDFVDNDSNATDCNGHGTHVAGTVGGSTYGVAKGVSLVAVRVLNCSGSGTTAGVVSGINWVTSHAIKPAGANMSLGGGVSTTLDNPVNASVSSP